MPTRSRDRKRKKPASASSSRRGGRLTQAEYARSRGITQQRVSALVRQGRITLRGGKIDPEQADAELAAGLDPAFSHLSSGRIAMGPEIGSTEFRKARAVREGYAARLARLEFERRSGQLVYVKEVKVAIFAIAREVRDKLLSISSRIGALVAAESDEFRCEQVIDREVREALRSLKDEELEERVATFNQRAKETALGVDSARAESEED